MFMAPNNNAVMSSVPPQRRGTASGLLGTFRFTGQSIGVALAGTIFASVAGASLGSIAGAHAGVSPERIQAFQDSFIRGLRAAAYAGIPFAAIGVVLSLLRGKHPLAPRSAEVERPSEPEQEPVASRSR